MTDIICIETSGPTCSVARFIDGDLLGRREENEDFSHAARLSVMLEEILGLREGSPTHVAISGGPGSYTGLRIGTSTAKGLAFGFSIPLISVSTLELMARRYSAVVEINEGDHIVPMIDARRMEAYTAVFDSSLSQIEEPAATILSVDSFKQYAKDGLVHCIGSGSKKAMEVLPEGKFRFNDDLGNPLADYMIELALGKIKSETFEDVAYYEPFYLKDFFMTSSPKNK